MEFIETAKGYIFQRECDRRTPKNQKKTYEIDVGLYATFRRKRNGDYDLCSLSFAKKFYTLETAEGFWSDIQVRMLTKKKDWNRKLPHLAFTIDVGNGLIIVGCYNGSPKYKTLKEQFEEMEEADEDSGIVDDWEEEAGFYDFDEDDWDEEESSSGKILPITGKRTGKTGGGKSGNQYIDAFNEYYDGSDKSAVSALGILNALTVGQEGMDPDAFAEKYGEEINEFFDFFMENVYSEKLEERMMANWGDLPRILRIAICLREEAVQEEYKEAKSQLNKKQRINAAKLAEYILRGGEHQKYMSGMVEDSHFYEAIVPGEYEESRDEVEGIIALLFLHGGTLMLRTVLSEDMHVMNAFSFLNGNVVKVPASDLKNAMELQPDGTRVASPIEKYQEAFLAFD